MTARWWLILGGALAVPAALVTARQAKRHVDPPVPILSRIPSIPGPQGHLFPSKPAVTDQLMVLVTPPLIIQNEDEATLLGQDR